jgi:gluconate 2-dehydrogenase gamma chain
MTSAANHRTNEHRRRILKLLAAAVPMSFVPGARAFAATVTSLYPKGYGLDVNMLVPEVTWESSLTDDQVRALQVLGDIIVPGDDRSPAASELDIAGFVNEWVSAPYPSQREDRQTIVDGLELLDRNAGRISGKRFLELTGPDQQRLFGDLIGSTSGQAGSPTSGFPRRLVTLFVLGYYTTREGMADIGYIGNTPMASFDGPPANIRKKLGL